jgi:hypothetical protein
VIESTDGLGGRVDRGGRDIDGGRRRADVDDAAAVGAEALGRFLGGQQQAQDVDVELAVEVLLGDVFQRRELVDAGVVDQDVHAAERLLGLVEQTGDVGALGHVALDGDGLAAGGGDLGHHLVGALAAGGVVDRHGRALGGQGLGDGGPDALRRAGHDGGLACKLAHDLSHSQVALSAIAVRHLDNHRSDSMSERRAASIMA